MPPTTRFVHRVWPRGITVSGVLVCVFCIFSTRLHCSCWQPTGRRSNRRRVFTVNSRSMHTDQNNSIEFKRVSYMLNWHLFISSIYIKTNLLSVFNVPICQVSDDHRFIYVPYMLFCQYYLFKSKPKIIQYKMFYCK